MDREIPAEAKRKNARKRIRIYTTSAIALIGIILLFSWLIHPSVKRSRLLTTIARQGPIEASLTASAVIIPECEEVITSPITAVIEKVNHPAGARVDSGQSILKLNKEFVILEYQKLLDQLELSKARYRKMKLSLERELFDLETRRDIKVLQVKALAAAYEDEKKLFGIGGGTEEEVEKAQMNYEISILEQKQLDHQKNSLKASQEAEMQEVELNINIMQKSVDELHRKIEQANIYALKNGVVTWVNESIGSTVQAGEVIARVAGINSFKAEGSISDIHADKLFPGQQVIIRVNETKLRGVISTVHPAVKNGIITFSITLKEKDNNLLRAQMKVETFIITGFKDKAVIVSNGPAFSGAEKQTLFIIQEGKAYKREVVTGLGNFDDVEVKSGIRPGEEVIISDMKSHENRESIKIKND